MTTKTAKFERYEPLAMDPQALSALYVIPASRANTVIGNTTVIDINGPLDAKNKDVFDSYESIRLRFDQALADTPKQICLLLSTPGGSSNGMAELSRYMRSAAAAAGKDLVAFSDTVCASAGMGLASAARKFTITPSTTVGSLGTMMPPRYDMSKKLEREGVAVHFITSGFKKAYGAVELPFTVQEETDSKRRVEALSQQFHQLLADHRGLNVSDIQAQEADLYLGEQALAVGLVDEIGTFESVFSQSFDSPSVSAASGDQAQEVTVSLEQIIQALNEIAKGEGEEADKAKKVLEAINADAETPEEVVDEPEDSTQQGQESGQEQGGVQVSIAAQAADQTVVALSKQVEQLSAQLSSLKAGNVAQERAALFAKHNVSAELQAALGDMPVAELQKVVSALAPKPTVNAALGGTLPGIQGKPGKAGGTQEQHIREVFGLADQTSLVSDNVQTFSRKALKNNG